MLALIEFYKRECKKIKKFNNPENLTLMQIQHKFAVDLGFQSWKDLLDKLKNFYIKE